jgi:hypothetical protein
VFACLLRLGAAAYWQQTAAAEGRLFRLGDSHSYWVLASQLGQGLPYEYGSSESRIFRAPLYPLVLAPLTRFQDELSAVWWARAIGCLLGTLSVGLVGWLAWRLAGKSAALIATGLAAVYPSAVGMSIVVLSEAVFMPLMLGYLLAWQAAWVETRNQQRWAYGLLAGALAGAAVLARPSWLLFAPFVWGLGMLTSADRWRHTVIFIATLLGLSVVMSPWWIRNALITGRFVPTTLQVGPSLLDGLHPGASGASDEGMAFMQAIIAEQMAADQVQLNNPQPPQSAPLVSTLEYRINARAQQVAMQWALQNPGETLVLAWRKFLRIWSLWPDGGDASSTPIRLALTLSSFSILLLACRFSFVQPRPGGWFYAILWLPSLYFTLLHMVFVGSIRYREPALLVLVAAAASALASLFYGHLQRVNGIDSSTTTSRLP